MRFSVRVSKWTLTFVGGLAVLLAGCGSSPVTTTGSAPIPSALNGNWLITGSLPFAGPFNFGTLNTAFGLAMTFSVQGSQLVADGTVNLPCGAFVSSSTGEIVTGTIASDGTFTAQAPAGNVPAPSTVQIKGTVPLAGANSWTGSYTFTSTNISCPLTMSGPFTAMRIANVTGTYSGSTTLNPSTGSTVTGPQPVTVSFALQQGATLPGSSLIEPQLLNGTVQVKGTSCFSSGTVSSVTFGGVLGTEFVTAFTMDDGSTMNVLGDVENVQAAKIGVHNLFGAGGKCGAFSSGPFEITQQ